MARRAFNPDDLDALAREAARGDNRAAVQLSADAAFAQDRDRVRAKAQSLGLNPDSYAAVPYFYDPQILAAMGDNSGVAPWRGITSVNPDGSVSIDQLRQQYQGSGAEFQGIPFDQWLSGPSSPWRLNAAGTAATYDQAKQTEYPSYDPKDSFMDNLGLYVIGGLAGAGLTGLLPGTESIFGGLGAEAGGATTDFSLSSATPQLVAGDAATSGAVNFADSFLPTLTSGGATDPMIAALSSMPSAAVPGVGGLSSGAISGILGGAAPVIGGPLGALTLDAAGNIVPQLTNLANSAISLPGGAATVAGGGGLDGGGFLKNLLKNSPWSAASQAIKSLTGTDVNPGWIDLLGKGLGAGIGILGSNQQNDALENLFNTMRGDRMPFLNKATGYLNDPSSFYSSPEATGAADAVLRRLSTTYGNPGVSPTAQSLATGALYDSYLGTVNSLGSLGLSGQGIQADLGKDIATSAGQPYAIAGNTIGNAFSSNLDLNQILAKALQKQYGLV